MTKSKSNRISVHHKSIGNKLFKENEHFKALCEYNKALLFAESKENLALAYANRSAVYLVIHKYDEALQNIQWARENGYPSDKIQKLNEREEKCKQFKQKLTKDPYDDVREFFKLSYPPNPKIPFIADCLRLGPKKKNGVYGIVTTRDLKAGDVVAVEKSTFANVHEQFSHKRCCKCLKVQMMNLIPCTKTASLMFCSEKCREETYAKVGNLDSMIAAEGMGIHPERILRETIEAFGGRQKLIEVIRNTDFENINYTVFDFDFSNPDDPNYKANLVKCIWALGSQGEAAIGVNNAKKLLPFIKAAVGNDQLLEKFLTKQTTICENRTLTNIFDTAPEFSEEILNVNAFVSHIRHRCQPNAFNNPTEYGWALCIIKPIKAGEEIFRNHYYGATGGKAEGIMAKVDEGSNAHCECHDCVNNLPGILPLSKEIPISTYSYDQIDAYVLGVLRKLTEKMVDFTPKRNQSFKDLIKQMMLNWADLDKYIDKHSQPSQTHRRLTKTLVFIMGYLSVLEFMPCPPAKDDYKPFAN